MYGRSEDSDDIVSTWFYLTVLPVMSLYVEDHAHAKYQITLTRRSNCIKVLHFLHYALGIK